jgi:hypothetical protein
MRGGSLRGDSGCDESHPYNCKGNKGFGYFTAKETRTTAVMSFSSELVSLMP